MAKIVEELTPEEVYERFQSNSIRCNSFTFEGIVAIFNYFETVWADEEYEFFSTINWDSMFYEKDTPEKLVQSLKPKEYKEIKNNYSEKNIRDKCMEFIEENYDWYEYLNNGGVIVYYPR